MCDHTNEQEFTTKRFFERKIWKTFSPQPSKSLIIENKNIKTSLHEDQVREINFSVFSMSLLQPPVTITRLMHESFPDSVTSTSDGAHGNANEDVLCYVAYLAAGMADVQEFSPDTWKEQLGTYLKDIKEVGDDEIEAFRILVAKETLGEDDESYGDDDDDGLEEVCNLRFK